GGHRAADRMQPRCACSLRAHRTNGNVRAVRRSVTVSGIGVVSAFGASADAFRDGLLEGRSGVAPVSGFDVTGCRSILAAEVTGFEPTAWISPMKLRRLDRTGIYAVAALRLAIEDAGVTIAPDGDD